MSRKTGAVTLLLVTIAASAAHGQDPDRPRALAPLRAEVAQGGYWFGGVERIMRLREELKLTDAQLAKLEEIRKQQVVRAQEMVELRSRVAAGQVEEDAMRAQIEQHNARFHQNAEEMRTRIDGILSKEQRDLLADRYRVFRGQGPLLRELRVRERLRPDEPLRRIEPLRPGERLRLSERLRPGERGPMLRLRERNGVLRRLDRLDSLPQYYWFGTPGRDQRPGVLRRRDIL